MSALDVKNNDLNVQNNLSKKAFCTSPLHCWNFQQIESAASTSAYCSQVAKVTMPQ